MEYRHDYKFSNNNKPITLTTEENNNRKSISFYDGNLHLFDDSIISVAIDVQKGLLFSKNYLIIEYKLGGFGNESIYSKRIPLLSNEVNNAKCLCEEAMSIIKFLKEDKERYHREQDEKIKKARETDTIEVVGLNGKVTKIWRRETFFNDTVLYSEGGHTYHTHADCFESWEPMYKDRFNVWRIITLEEAESNGLKECKLCEKYYEPDEDDNLDF